MLRLTSFEAHHYLLAPAIPRVPYIGGSSMRERAHAVFAAVGLSLTVASAPRIAAAQVHGIPVYNSGIPTGIGVYADVGFPNTDAGKGRALALTGRAGLGPFGATAILSTFNPEGPGDSELSVGGTLNYKVFGGPLIPLSVTLQGGIGYSKPEAGFLPIEDVNEFRIPRWPSSRGSLLGSTSSERPSEAPPIPRATLGWAEVSS